MKAEPSHITPACGETFGRFKALTGRGLAGVVAAYLMMMLLASAAMGEPNSASADEGHLEGVYSPDLPNPPSDPRVWSGTVRLRPRATVSELRVRLRDVADLSGDTSPALGATIVATLDPTDEQRSIRIESIRRTLDERGVNWGRLTLGGFTTCQVWRVADASPPSASQQPTGSEYSSQPQTVQTNLVDEISLGSALTLRTRLTRWIQDWAGAKPEQLRLTFNKHDKTLLDRSAWHDRYEFEPLGSGPLGRIPIVIRQYRDGRVIQTDRVTVDVHRRFTAVVTTNTVSRGQTFTDRDVQVREVFVTDDTGDLMTDPSRVVGQQAAAVLRPGTRVKARHLRSPLLVRRGEPVMVRTITGGLVVKTVARAMKNGSMDEVIDVRNERSREVYSVRVSGVQQAVLLTSERPAPQPTSGPGLSSGMEDPS